MKSIPIPKASALIICFFLIAFVFMAKAQAQEKVLTLKVATNAEPWLSIGKGWAKFAELVNERSQGKVKVEVFYSGALGSEVTAIRNLLADTVQLANCSDGNLGAHTDAYYFMNMPYVFNGTLGLRKVVNTPWMREYISEKISKTNLKQLMFFDNGGPRHIQTTKKQIKVPNDLKGVKIRTTASKIEVEVFKNFGALPTVINWDEMYTALEQGTVDGEAIQHTWTYSAKHYEVTKFVCENAYVIGTQNAFIRLDLWNTLSKDIQDLLQKAAQDAEAWEIEFDAQYTKDARDKIVEKGVRIYTPTEAEMKLWRDAAVPKTWETFKDQVSVDFLRKVQALQ